MNLVRWISPKTSHSAPTYAARRLQDRRRETMSGNWSCWSGDVPVLQSQRQSNATVSRRTTDSRNVVVAGSDAPYAIGESNDVAICAVFAGLGQIFGPTVIVIMSACRVHYACNWRNCFYLLRLHTSAYSTHLQTKAVFRRRSTTAALTR